MIDEMLILPNLIYRVNTIQSEFQEASNGQWQAVYNSYGNAKDLG